MPTHRSQPQGEHELTPREQQLVCGAWGCLPEAALLVSRTGTVLLANRAARRLFPESGARLIGAHVDTVLAPLSTITETADRMGPEGEPGESVTRPIAAPDRDVALQVTRCRCEHGCGDEVAFVIVLRDVSTLLALRRERDRLLRLATVGQVMPSILHELKNPLASISTAVELMIEEQAGPAIQRDLHAILSEIRRMRLSMEGLGAAGRGLEADRHAAIDLAIRDACQILQRKAADSGVRLAIAVDDLPVLRLDPAGIRAIVFNLVMNAIHACQDEDVIQVTAALAPDGRRLIIRVSDSGCGMDEPTLARCQELFFTTKAGGSGIGLSLCRQIADESGGELAVESIAGQGTDVLVTIPIRERNAATTPQSARAKERGHDAPPRDAGPSR